MSIGMGLAQQPRVVWNATTLNFSRPARPWRPITVAAGAGREESASGVPAVWVTSRRYLLEVPLRFTEAEWPSVRAWIVWAMDSGGSFTFRPDQDVAAEFTCYLASPRPDEEVSPARGEHLGELDLTVRLRTTVAAAVIEPEYAP